MKKKGFTLVELMIALAIFSLLMGYMYRVFFDQIRNYNSVNNKNHTQYSGRNAMDIIIDRIRKSDDMISFVPSASPKLSDGSAAVEKLIDEKNRILIDLNESDDTKYKGDINYSNTKKALIDAEGNVLCSEITSLSIYYKEDTGFVKIYAELASGKETYQLVTGINVEE